MPVLEPRWRREKTLDAQQNNYVKITNMDSVHEEMDAGNGGNGAPGSELMKATVLR